MKIRFMIILFVLVCASYAQVEHGNFMHEGKERYYITYLPPDYEPNLPLVLSFHGLTYSPQWFMDNTHMKEVADTANFVVCYPQGMDLDWQGAPEDITFIDRLIDTLYANYQIDPDHVYACGWSAGAGMSLLLGYELPHRIKKIGSVSILLPSTYEYIITDGKPIPLCFIIGTDDFLQGNPYRISTEETMSLILERNGCSDSTLSIYLPDKDVRDGTKVEVVQHVSCPDSSRLLLYNIHGGGHWWPGLDTLWEGTETIDDFDDVSQEIIADVELWRFFSQDTVTFPSGVWCKQIWTSDSYCQGGDSLRVFAEVTNLNNHEYELYAHIYKGYSTFIDSVQLFDDGQHGDIVMMDGISVNYVPMPEEENFYNIRISSKDLDDGTYFPPHEYYPITTAGPVIFDSLNIVYGTPQPGKNIKYDVAMMNAGNTLTLTDLSLTVSTTDTNVQLTNILTKVLPDMETGESGSNSGDFYMKINETCPGNHDVQVDLSIGSNGIIYWKDTCIIHIDSVVAVTDIPGSFTLEQNYPNPFNPSTAINYQLTADSPVELTIYDISGKKVTTLVNDMMPAGYHTLHWDAYDFSSGIYIYRLKAGNFVKTKKMILMK